jgi:HpiC1 cyclase
MRARIFLITVLICFALLGSSAWADGITVTNGSFEQFNPLTVTGCGAGCSYNWGPIPGWTTITGAAGSWQPGPSGAYFNQPLPDGSIVAFVNGTLSQDIGADLAPNSFYTLTVDVGDRLDGYRGGWSIALDAGGTAMCTNSGSTAAITPGTFAQETCSFGTGATVPSGDLVIVLGGSGPADNATFDRVTVNTPEPASAALLGIGLFFIALVALYKREHTSKVMA